MDQNTKEVLKNCSSLLEKLLRGDSTQLHSIDFSFTVPDEVREISDKINQLLHICQNAQKSLQSDIPIELELINSTMNLFTPFIKALNEERKIGIDTQESRERLRRAELASKTGNWELHINTRLIKASEGALVVYGLSETESDYLMIQQIPLPEYRPILDKALKDLIYEGIPYDVEFKIRTMNSGIVKDIHSRAEYNSERNIVFGVIQDITELKLAANIIIEISRIHELLLDNSTLGIGLVRERKFEWVNKRMAELLLLPLHELNGASTRILYPSDQIYAEMENCVYNNTSQSNSDQIIQISKSNGNKFWCRFIGKTIDPRNPHAGSIWMLEDVTEKKLAEDMIKESEERHRSFFENAPVGVFHSISGGRFLTVNIELARILGYCTPEEMIKDIVDIEKQVYLDKKTRDDVLSRIQGAEGWVHFEELFWKKKTGDEVIVQLSARKVNAEDDNASYYEGFVQDITESRRAEAQFKYISSLHNLILENSSLGIAFIKDRRFEWVNQRVAELFLMPRDEIQGASTRVIYPSNEIYDDLNFGAYPILARGDRYDSLLQLKKHDGSLFWCRFMGKALYPDNPQAGSIWMFEDVTEKKQAEIQLHEYTRELQELNSTKDRFFSIIAHDLKSPFHALLGSTELLSAQYRTMEAEEVEFLVESINDLSKNTFRLLENLLEWSRLQTGKLQVQIEKLSVFTEVLGVVTLLKPVALKKNITLHYAITHSLTMTGDQKMVATVIRNLVSNAIKFTMDGGYIIISALNTGTMIEINVSDSGIGISPENIAKLFKIDKVVSTKGTQDERGTGLGLLLCKEMVEKMNGKIWVKSEPGRGTKFTFSIPAAE
ncbi:MAG: PAS domain S-box protein [Ignavibacteria bacterium]|nr:PAS domain S-box protein [Ignavibacteria bacterium]